MHFYRLTTSDHEMYDKAMALYQSSFPIHECREPDAQVQALAHAQYHFNLIYDEALWVGLLLCWQTDDFIYIEHFCILPQLRGRQYGQRALALLEAAGKTVILEIDPPTDEVSIRRKAFYERCGYCANTFEHVHPPYRKGFAGHRLVVMSRPDQLKHSQYDAFAHHLRHVVMAD